MRPSNYGILTSTKYEWPGGALTPRAVAPKGQVSMQDHDTPNNNLIPYGHCHCGCGEKTNIAKKSDTRRGRVKGEPALYIAGHQRRKRRDHGYMPKWNSGGGYYEIPIPGGRIAKIDAQDLGVAIGLAWSETANGYAQATRDGKKLSLHREIMKTSGLGHSVHVDHINGDKLDNRRSNLRVVTPQQNRMNIHSTTGVSGFIGVAWNRSSEKWQVLFKVRGKAIYIGVFHCPIEAAVARDIAAIELHGEFASLNFPELREVFA